MLVLSRRQDDRVLFPNLGVSVHILRIAGNKVRLGVEAPPNVKVLRHELQPHKEEAAPACVPMPAATEDDLRLQRRLRAAAESLNELYSLSDKDLNPESERLIFDIFRHLKSIDEDAAEKNLREPAVVNPRARRALLVEDNVNESKLLAGYLRLRSFEVAVAEDGAAAIDYLSSHDEPDVVLMDMQMPGMDGPTAIRKMRAEKRHDKLKVYAVSGSDPADYGVDVGPKGVDGWFPKPLDPEALVFRLAFDDQGLLIENEKNMSGRGAAVSAG